MNISLSGMLAFQRALDVTSHNIANANTPGYSRQVANFTARPGTGIGVAYVGSGTQIASIERMYDVHRDTISRLMVRTGMNCMTIMDDLMQDIPTGVYQCDEIWCFVRKKDKHLKPDEKKNPEVGSQFIFIAMEAESKLIPSWR